MDSDFESQSNRKSGRGRGRGRGRPPGRPAKKSKKKSAQNVKEEPKEKIVSIDKNLENNINCSDVTTSETDFEFNTELDESLHSELTSHPISFVSPSSKPLHKNEPLNWKYRVNLIGEKVVNPHIHCCEKCHLPILVYGRMIGCKHVFCLSCAKQNESVCPRCNEKVNRIERSVLGTIFMCQTESCKRTYLSQRDLQAHIQHRHFRRLVCMSALNPSNTTNAISTTTNAMIASHVGSVSSTPNTKPLSYNSYQSPIPVVSSRSNLITVPIQEEVSSNLNPMTQTVSSQPSVLISSQRSVSNYVQSQQPFAHHNPHIQWPAMPNTNNFGYRAPPPWPPLNPYNNPYNRQYYPQ